LLARAALGECRALCGPGRSTRLHHEPVDVLAQLHHVMLKRIVDHLVGTARQRQSRHSRDGEHAPC
jgi:hypothetical protein